MPPPTRILATVAMSAGLLGCSAPADHAARAVPMAGVLTNAAPASASAEPRGAISVALAPVSVRYTFDAGVTHPILDEAGAYELRPLGENTGTLSLVRQNGGLALQYPARCTLPDESRCPRAILEGSRDDSLNPGTRPLRYGASILMTREDLADGANVVQKGYSVGGSTQFKLQVDHEQGHPSCVIASPGKIYKAEPKLNVADGVWHDLACGRDGNRLTLTVDGTPGDSVEVPADLSIANAEPLRVGGKGPTGANDQYAGQIDNVFLTID